jgi:hypothetical protein
VIEKRTGIRHIYLLANGTLLEKRRYDLNSRKFVPTAMLPGAAGIDVSASEYGKGAERVVFRCNEVIMACVWGIRALAFGNVMK